MAANDAFTAGVRPGGLTSSTEIRLLLCYLVKNAGPIARQEIANAFFHAIEFEYSWLVFLSNIMLFTMEGDIKDRFISVELGGLVGMVLTVLAMLAIGALTPVLGGMLGLLLPLGVVLFILIILHPYAPKVLNNVGFAYLTVACIDSAAFAANLPLFFGVYIVGSLVFNGGCVLLMKPARYLAARSVKADA